MSYAKLSIIFTTVNVVYEHSHNKHSVTKFCQNGGSFRPKAKFLSIKQLQDSPNGTVMHFKVLSGNFRPIKRFGRQMGMCNYT